MPAKAGIHVFLCRRQSRGYPHSRAWRCVFGRLRRPEPS